MKPLSVLYYLKSNIKHTLPVGLSITLGVMFFYFLFLAGAQANNLNYATHLNPYRYFSIITHNNNLPSELSQKIREDGTIERIIPFRAFPHIQVTAALGNNSAGILQLREADIKYLMERMGLTITEGRLPHTEQEVLLHWRVAANKKITIGDILVDNNELNNRLKVVGIFDGDCVLGFSPSDIEGSTIDDWGREDLLLLPVADNINLMNDHLLSLPGASGVNMELLSAIEKEVADSTKNLDTVMLLLVILVILVLCVTLSDTSILHFYLRKNEFGLLTVIGYTRWEIIKRLWLEEILTYGISFLTGILFSILLAFGLNVLIWNPMGENVSYWSTKGFFLTAAIPVIVTLFSVMPTVRLLRRKDMIQVIEGR